MSKAKDRTGREIAVGDIVSSPVFHGDTFKVTDVDGEKVRGKRTYRGRNTFEFAAATLHICSR